MALVLLAVGCSSSGDSSSPATTVLRPVGPPAEGAVAVPAVQGPVTGGKGATVLGPGGFDLATVGYQQE